MWTHSRASSACRPMLGRALTTVERTKPARPAASKSSASPVVPGGWSDGGGKTRRGGMMHPTRLVWRGACPERSAGDMR